jgi:hypothetical protein
MRTYTFVCLAENQVAVTVDARALDDYRAHGWQLFRDHAGVASIEVWCGDVVVETLTRDGVRPWPLRDAAAPASSDEASREALEI